MKDKFKLDQMKAALAVLKDMKKCIAAGTNYFKEGERSFNLHRDFGICWHVYANTIPAELGGCDLEYLSPFFIEMGYDRCFPVECAVIVQDLIAEGKGTEIPDPEVLHNMGGHVYATHRGYKYNDDRNGVQRNKILQELIELFEKKLANV